MKSASGAAGTKPTAAKSPPRWPRRGRKALPASLAWIGQLARPYLKGYRPVRANVTGLEGYWFVADAPPGSQRQGSRRSRSPAGHPRPGAGFFVGYLTEAAADYSFLKPAPPECAVFAWVSPVEGALHRRLVGQPGSLVRKTFDYIRWLTHRPPRFVFHQAETAAMARHASMADWPVGKRRHLSRNFFIETLAWLVRSGLVGKLPREASNDRS